MDLIRKFMCSKRYSLVCVQRGNIYWSIGALFAKICCEASSSSLSLNKYTLGSFLCMKLGSLGGSIEQKSRAGVICHVARKKGLLQFLSVCVC